MTTLADLQEKLVLAKDRKAIYTHLVEHLESEFLSSLGGPPKKVLLTNDKTKVSVASIEVALADLTGYIKETDEEIAKLLNTPLSEATVQ